MQKLLFYLFSAIFLFESTEAVITNSNLPKWSCALNNGQVVLSGSYSPAPDSQHSLKKNLKINNFNFPFFKAQLADQEGSLNQNNELIKPLELIFDHTNQNGQSLYSYTKIELTQFDDIKPIVIYQLSFDLTYGEKTSTALVSISTQEEGDFLSHPIYLTKKKKHVRLNCKL